MEFIIGLVIGAVFGYFLPAIVKRIESEIKDD